MSARLPVELGELVEVHRPMRGYTGWIACLAFPTVLGLAWLATPEDGPLLGLFFFVVIGVPVVYATGEWFLLEHRIYQHGIVFRCLLPGLKTYVVPYYTCEPDSFSTIGRRVHNGDDVYEIVNRRFRQCPLTRTNINMSGLDPSIAMQIGSGKQPWTAGIDSDPPNIMLRANGTLGLTRNPVLEYQQVWCFSSRTPQHHIDLLGTLIADDHRTSRSSKLKRRGMASDYRKLLSD